MPLVSRARLDELAKMAMYVLYFACIIFVGALVIAKALYAHIFGCDLCFLGTCP